MVVFLFPHFDSHVFLYFFYKSKRGTTAQVQNKWFFAVRIYSFLPQFQTIPRQSGSSDKGRTTKMATSVMRSASRLWKSGKMERRINDTIIITLQLTMELTYPTQRNFILNKCFGKGYLSSQKSSTWAGSCKQWRLGLHKYSINMPVFFRHKCPQNAPKRSVKGRFLRLSSNAIRHGCFVSKVSCDQNL